MRLRFEPYAAAVNGQRFGQRELAIQVNGVVAGKRERVAVTAMTVAFVNSGTDDEGCGARPSASTTAMRSTKRSSIPAPGGNTAYE